MAHTDPTSPASLCAAASAFEKGQTLAGTYRLERPLGRDAAFTRWLAHDEQLDAPVALHFLPDAVAGDDRALAELRQEVKRSRQLVHPHVVRVHDLIVEEKWAALATDFVDGKALSALLAEKNGGAFEPAEIQAWVQQLCQTLEDAHRIGLLHRDLRPENLVVTKSGDLMVSSFGASRTILDALVRARIPIPAGSDIAYASPQQLDGERPARADDIYAVGATLYDLLTGKPPFYTGDLVPQVRKTTPPPVSERRAELKAGGAAVPKSWDTAIAACLDKHFEARPKTAAAVAAQLEPVTQAKTASPVRAAAPAAAASVVTPAPPPQRRETPAPAAPIAAKQIDVQIEKPEPARKSPPPARSSFAPPGENTKDPDGAGFPFLKVAAVLMAFGIGLAVYFLVRPSKTERVADAPTEQAGNTPASAIETKRPASTPVSGAITPAVAVAASGMALERPTPIPEESRAPEEQAAPAAASTPPPPAEIAAAEQARRRAETAAAALAEKKKQQADAEAALAGSTEQLEKARVAAAAAEAAMKKLNAERETRKAAAASAETAAAEAAKAAEVKAQAAVEAKAAAEAFEMTAAEPVAAAEEAAKAVSALEADIAEKETAVEETIKAGKEAAIIREQEALALAKAEEAVKRLAAEAEAARAAEAEARRAAQEERQAQLAARAAAAQKAAAEAQRLATEARQALEQAELLREQVIEAQKKAEEAQRSADEAASAAGEEALPAPAMPAASPSAAADRAGNALGMQFAPVGSVLFSIWHTRVQDFEAFVKASGSPASAWRSPGFKQGPDHPVVNVTWNDAAAFCKWLTDEERRRGGLAAGKAYRLPTDLEWSEAAGLPPEEGETPQSRDLGDLETFPWGTQWPPPANAGNYSGEETGLDAALPGYNDGFAWTSPVGSFPPNRFGLYDMGGNASQWVMDWWNAQKKEKVLRGGSWFQGALKLSLLASSRFPVAPTRSTDSYGFRVVIADDVRTKRAAL